MSNAIPLDCYSATCRQAARALFQYYSGAMQKTGIEGTHFTLCAEILANPGITSGELGRRLVMDKSTLTRTLHLMESLDLIHWLPGQDRREKRWHLSAHGRALHDQALPVWQGLQASLQARLGESFLEEWRQLTYRLTALITDEAD